MMKDRQGSFRMRTAAGIEELVDAVEETAHGDACEEVE